MPILREIFAHFAHIMVSGKPYLMMKSENLFIMK